MKDLIPFDKRYDFGFLEERNEIGEHPCFTSLSKIRRFIN